MPWLGWELPRSDKDRLRSLLCRDYDSFLAEWKTKGERGHREQILEFLGRYSSGGRVRAQQQSP